MPQCAKCGKTVKVFYGKWKYEDSFPEFYDKPLCNSCYKMLNNARIESAVEELCEHLRLLGLGATVESEKRKRLWQWKIGTIIGSIRVVNRNIDLIELERWHEVIYGGEDAADTTIDRYRCHYLVQAKVDGLEDKLKAESKPAKVKKGSSRRETVGFQWEGKELAKILNSDDRLKSLLNSANKLALLNKGLTQLPDLEIKPQRKHQCIRIKPKHYHDSPAAAFPTIETFEAYDRIAHHIRSITNVPP